MIKGSGIKGSCHCGSVRWLFTGYPEHATACNCTVCRRYGALWAYAYDGMGIQASGATARYARGDNSLAFHFCRNCGCVSYWRALQADAEGRYRMAVNLRLADPDDVANIPINHFDGFDSFKSLGKDGKCVGDYWF